MHRVAVPILATAELGPHVAVFVGYVTTRLIAVVNTAAARNPDIRDEAAATLRAHGVRPNQIDEVLDGVRG